MVVRSHSRGRFDRPPMLDAGDYKKASYTPRGSAEAYATPPRSPLDAVRSASRGRFAGREGGRDYEDRNPLSEGRSHSHSSYGRERYDDADSTGGSSAAHAREVLSKIRGGRGMYSEPPKSTLHRLGRSLSHTLAASSPRRRLDLDRDHDDYDEFSSPSRYEVLGMKEEIKKRNTETAELRRELDDMTVRYEEDMTTVRSKLVSTFKEDMQEMKTEWEEAFRRLKDESDATQRAMEMELNDAMRAKREMEGEASELRAEYRQQIEEEKARSKEQLEELKRSKEEDLERLRAMYEEHLDSTKKTGADVEGELREEIHVLLEENEKVKLCYDNLESELNRYKSDLDEINANYQRAVQDNVRWEKEANNYKEELDEVLDENQKRTREAKALEGELASAKEEVERMDATCQRAREEKERFQKELEGVSKERDEATEGYNDLVKKLDGIQEERTLEGRYTEALVKQRDNMNAIIENGQAEIEELKGMNTELSREKLELSAELAQTNKMKERLETLGRERERYNATVKALKVDLRALHGGEIGPETSLQEHMRLLNERWDESQSRLKGVDKLKRELDESVQLLEENVKDRERMVKEHQARVGSLERELEETQTALVKMEREKMTMNDKLADYELAEAKKKRIHEELEARCEKLQDQLKYAESERRECRSLKADLDKALSRRAELEETLGRTEDVKKGLKKKLESAYYELEETQREMHSLDAELSKRRSQEEEIKSLTEALTRAQEERAFDIEDAKAKVEESFKVQLRLMEEKHADQDRRNGEYLEQKHKDEIEELRKKNAELEAAMKDQKESLDQKSMAEIKRRGEFAKQKQELEILRSKERHLETHVNQLEEHISKVVADYETRLQSSNATICSTSDGERSLRKQVKELEKKLEVSSAAMKQIGKSSLLMEKENERLKHDKNELKLKLKKLVDCAEKFGPK